MYESKTAAQTYALAVGLALLALGAIGLIVEPTSDLETTLGLSESLLEPWHSGSYVLAGLLGLATWRRADSARIYAMGVGIVYLLLAAWGLVAASVPVTDAGFALPEPQLAGDVFHAVLGLASLAIGMASPRHGRYPLPADAT